MNALNFVNHFCFSNPVSKGLIGPNAIEDGSWEDIPPAITMTCFRRIPAFFVGSLRWISDYIETGVHPTISH